MGYGFYERDGMERGYSVEDVCNHKSCKKEINRGLAYLCYSCGKYFCDNHLTFKYNKDDNPIEFECFAGESNQVCKECSKLKAD